MNIDFSQKEVFVSRFSKISAHHRCEKFMKLKIKLNMSDLYKKMKPLYCLILWNNVK